MKIEHEGLPIVRCQNVFNWGFIHGHMKIFSKKQAKFLGLNLQGTPVACYHKYTDTNDIRHCFTYVKLYQLEDSISTVETEPAKRGMK